MYYLCSENKGADQRLCFRICQKSRFSHNEAQIIENSRLSLTKCFGFIKTDSWGQKFSCWSANMVLVGRLDQLHEKIPHRLPLLTTKFPDWPAVAR